MNIQFQSYASTIKSILYKRQKRCLETGIKVFQISPCEYG